MTEAPAARRLAEFCGGIAWAGIAPAARERTKELLLDHLAAVLAGQGERSTQAVQTFTAGWAGEGASTVIGAGRRTGAAWAALANGAAAHAIEIDDGVRESSLHPGAPVIPAALAVAEQVGASPRELLEAIVAGYEVVIRAGRALDPASSYRRGFHPTGIAGVFGAAVAAGQLLRLDAAALTNALGIAGTMASGSLEYLSDGSLTKRLTPGWAAHGGVVAAGLAASGYTGPSTVFEGPLGFLHAYSDAGDPRALTTDLGDPYLVMRVGLKTYACCRYIHGVIDCVLALRERLGLRPEDVAGVELGILGQGWLLVADPIERKRDPRSTVDAQFSAPFAVALALVAGRAGPAEFTLGALHDPRIRRLMASTECVQDPALDARFPSACPARVRLTLADGRIVEESLEYPRGEPENALSRDELRERFVELTAARLEERDARTVIELVLRLDGERELLPLMRILGAPAKSAAGVGGTR